jgi:proline iminopeptidase
MKIRLNDTALWFDVTGSSLVLDGSTLRERPTVVLVHGGPGGFDHSYLRPDFDRLATIGQVVYVDLRGHGRSDWGDAEDWTFEACADDLRAFCDALDIRRPVLLGHSMGGPVVLLYAARHPGHAAGLVVADGFARWDHDRLVEGFRTAAGDEVAEMASRDFLGEDVSHEESDRVFSTFGPHVPDAEREAHTPHNAQLNKHGMALIRRLDMTAQLDTITCPTLVQVGALDPVTPLGAAQEIVAALPAGVGRLEVIPDAGHFPWLDAPERYWASLIDFVTSAGWSNRFSGARPRSIHFGHDPDTAALVLDDAATGRRRTGQAGARGSRGQVGQAVGDRPDLRVRPDEDA